jgi:hypothetical protein
MIPIKAPCGNETASTVRSNTVERDGYIRLDAPNSLTENENNGLNMIRCLSNALPPDPYDTTGCRMRLYGRLMHMPWLNVFEPFPALIDSNGRESMIYQQPESLNSQEGGKPRVFPTFPRSFYFNPLLNKLIRDDLALCSFGTYGYHTPIQIGVHIIRLEAKPGRPGIVSPPFLHRDGEWYTAAHLIEFSNATGAENWNTDPSYAGMTIDKIPASAVKAGFTLTKQLSGYLVRDDRVAHSVEAVHVAEGKTLGVRTILLIDFTPLKPILLLNAA